MTAVYYNPKTDTIAEGVYWTFPDGHIKGFLMTDVTEDDFTEIRLDLHDGWLDDWKYLGFLEAD